MRVPLEIVAICTIDFRGVVIRGMKLGGGDFGVESVGNFGRARHTASYRDEIEVSKIRIRTSNHSKGLRIVCLVSLGFDNAFW